MLAKIQTWLGEYLPAASLAGDAQEQHTLQMAAAVLLLEVARADFEHDAREIRYIADALKSAFALHPDEIEELIEQANKTLDKTVSLHSFIRMLNEQLSQPEKVALLERLWDVAYADGRIDKYEDHSIRKLSDLLYIPHRDFIRSKHRAAEKQQA